MSMCIPVWRFNSHMPTKQTVPVFRAEITKEATNKLRLKTFFKMSTIQSRTILTKHLHQTILQWRTVILQLMVILLKNTEPLLPL